MALTAALHLLKARFLADPFCGALESPRRRTAVCGSLTVSGWTFSRSGDIASVDALLDGVSLGTLQYGLQRADVAKVFPHLEVDRCGYVGRFALGKTAEGTHTLTVRATDSHECVREYRRTIVVQRGKGLPQDGAATDEGASEPPSMPVPQIVEKPTAARVERRRSARLPYRSLSRPAGHGAFLIVSERVPTPDFDSGSFRMFQILKLLLDSGFRVTLISDAPRATRRHIEAIQDVGATVLVGWQAAMEHLETEGSAYHYVLLSGPDVAFKYMFPVRATATDATIAYDTIDLRWIRLQRAVEVGGADGLRERMDESRRIERFNALTSDITLAITEIESRILVETDPGLKTAVIPNIHPSVAAPARWTSRRDLMFIGGFWHEPNEDAVRHFVADVLPLVRRRLPDVVFHVIGSRMPDSVRGLASDSVNPIGYVRDPSLHFARSRVFVAPLRYGAGMKGKIGQSMGFGLPVVTTTVGAEGMMLVDGEHALIADTAPAFADAVVRIYTDQALWAMISTNALAHIRQHFSSAAARDRLAEVFPRIALPHLRKRATPRGASV